MGIVGSSSRSSSSSSSSSSSGNSKWNSSNHSTITITTARATHHHCEASPNHRYSQAIYQRNTIPSLCVSLRRQSPFTAANPYTIHAYRRSHTRTLHLKHTHTQTRPPLFPSPHHKDKLPRCPRLKQGRIRWPGYIILVLTRASHQLSAIHAREHQYMRSQCSPSVFSLLLLWFFPPSAGW